MEYRSFSQWLRESPEAILAGCVLVFCVLLVLYAAVAAQPGNGWMAECSRSATTVMSDGKVGVTTYTDDYCVDQWKRTHQNGGTK